MMKLTLILNGITQKFELDQDLITIGRSPESTIRIKNKKISRNHAKIERVGAAFQITDLASGNGTRVDGKKIDFSPISKDTVIKIGDAVLTVDEIDDEPEGISLDDEDDKDLLTDDDTVHEAKTERNLTPLEPGLHSKDTEMEIELPPKEPKKEE